ncbi:MAG TPA: aldo/keto reductase [Kofleriaceae bacterium]|nr:aldo/keto reductase [Kofleriaceae bacterium]
MRAESFGPLDRAVPVIGHGTWQLERDQRSSAVAAIRRAIDLGMTHIDTAEMYGSGWVEELVREALEGRRERVFLASKVLPDNASHDGTIHACEETLRRLGTDWLDLYMLHWRGRHPLDGTIAAFEALRRSGKIRAWGVSNFDVPDLEAALAIAGEGAIACNQVLYHLKQRTVEHAVLPWCERNRVALVAYSPLGCGNFPTGRRPGAAVLADIASARGVTPHAVALGFLTRHRSVFAIPKSASTDHVAANAAAGDLTLEPDEIARIEAAFPLGRWRGLPML